MRQSVSLHINENILDKAALYATALTFTNALYTLRKELGTEKATIYLRNLGKLVFIAPTTQLEVDKAFQSVNPDFEDAIQYFSARSVGANVIITRDQKHFRFSEIPVMDTDEFMKG